MTVQEQRVLDKLKYKLRADAAQLINQTYCDIARDDGTFTRQPIPGLIDQLESAIANGREQKRILRSKRGSPIVISVQAFDLRADIDHVTREWSTSRYIADRISIAVAHHCARSVDAIPDIRYISRYLESWVRLIGDLFEPPRLLHLVAACPHCGEATVTMYHMDDTESVLGSALQIMRTQDGLVCECLACGTRWPDTHFLLLAQALGCEAVV